MRNKIKCLRHLCAFCFIAFASICTKGATSGDLFVKVGDTSQSFEVSEVKEVTFSDEMMTVVRIDETTVTFAGEWQITFGNVPEAGLVKLTVGDADGSAVVYNLEGMPVLNISSLASPELKSLPSGVYIVKCNGKSLKIKI